MRTLCVGMLVVGLVGLPAGILRSQATPTAIHIVLPNEIQWQEDDPDFSHADMLGNPGGPGLYMFRSKGKDGSILPPHWHPGDEHFTVISGTFLVGVGDKFDEQALQAIPTGAHAVIPANVHHFCKNRGETVIEIYGEGPFAKTDLRF